MNFSSFSKITIASVLFCACGVLQALAAPWSFGVIADTQWTCADDGKNPNTVAADIIRQINAEFIAKKVSLVIAVGDTVNKANKTSLATRALYAQDLYNAGIAFYPLRGNHDASMIDSGLEFARLFPQTANGQNSATPADVVASKIIPAPDLAANPPAEKKGEPFPLGTQFSAPETNATFHSLSYSFDFNNARFVLLDQFDNSGQTMHSTIAAQLGWIDSRLSDPRPMNAIVFGHKSLFGSAHKDTLFGNNTSDDPSQHPMQDRFLSVLARNGVHFYICGHDHHHKESSVTSADGKNTLQQIICASASSKFYAPKPPFAPNEKVVAVDLNKIGFYICTVDGPRVTMDYYGVDISSALDKQNGIATTPQLTGNWKKISTSGYSLEEAGK